MKQNLAFHAPILKEIKTTISQKYNIKAGKIELPNVEIINESILRFQLSFFYTYSDPMKNVFLNFEIKDISPHALSFETLSGIRTYEESNQYHGLMSEIVKSIANQIENE